MDKLKEKILVFGSTGMVGHIITLYLSELKKYNILNTSRSKLNNDTILLDVQDHQKVENLIHTTKPNIIINCVGVLIKESAQRPDKAVYLNSYFPHFLEWIGQQQNIKIVHLSTDCVFSGKKGGYCETDCKDGSGFYAESKALGEINNSKDLTIRTSFVGPELKMHGSGLFNWFIMQNNAISGYSDVYWTGFTTLEIAKAVDLLINQNLKGLYHLVPQEKISKYHLLELMKKIFNKQIDIKEDHSTKSDKSLINTRKDFQYPEKSYETMMKELYEWMKVHSLLYQHYPIKF